MSATLTPSPYMQFFTATGVPLAGGLLYTYDAGTTQAAITYTDATATSINTNPVVLNARGECSVWLLAAAYKFVLRDSTGALIWTADNLSGLVTGADLANSSSSTLGSALVGYLPAGTGAVGTTVQAKLRQTISVKDFGAVGDGLTDDTAALVAALAAAPVGAQLIIKGLLRVTSTINWNKRVNPYCAGANDGIVLAVGSANDGIVFSGTDPTLLYGLNGMDIRLNVYGGAACCKHAVVFNRLDRSNVVLNVRAGAIAYGVRVRGCLINTWNVQSSVNYAPPISSPGMQLHHMLVENFGAPVASLGTGSISFATPAVCTLVAHGLSANDTVIFTGANTPSPIYTQKPYFVLSAGLTANSFQFSEIQGGTPVATTQAGSCTVSTATAVASNTNDFYVNFEGATDGYIQSAQPGEGSNTVTGEIEGLAGSPVYVNASTSFTVANTRMEANAVTSSFYSCEGLHIGPGVLYYGGVGYSDLTTIVGAQNYKVDGYYGSLTIDSSSFGGTLGQVEGPIILSQTVADPSIVQTASITNSTTRTTVNGPGAGSYNTLFVNPYTEIYGAADPAVGPPVGFTLYGASGALVNETVVTFPGNWYNQSVKGTSSTAGGTQNGCSIANVTANSRAREQWLSLLIPTYSTSTSGLCNIFVWLNGGSQVYLLSQTLTTQINTWVEHRAGFLLPSNATFTINIALQNNVGVSAGAGVTYYVGGVNLVRGAIPPRELDSSYARQAYVSPSVTYRPPFVGCRAYVSGTGKWYLAKDTGSGADWVILN